MLSPSDRLILVASGGTALVGRTTAITAPGSGGGGTTGAWLSAAVLNKAIPIAGTSNLAGATSVWSGWACDLTGNRMWYFAPGGHNDSSYNGVTQIDFNADAPAWRQICAPSVSPVIDTPWYSDGKGISNHLYDYSHWVPSVGRLVKHGLRGMYGNGNDGQVVQTFNPDSAPPAWEPAGTYTYGSGKGYGLAVDHIHGEIAVSSGDVFRVATNNYAVAATNMSIPARYPVAYSTVGDFYFSLQWGGGEEGYATLPTALNASYWTRTGSQPQHAVTFNTSAAYTQFVNEGPSIYNPTAAVGNCGMCYDSINNCFYWYSGQPGREGHVFVIRPIIGGNWDMEVFQWAPGSASLATAPSSGINGRIKYFPLLKGFIISPDGGTLHFVKTSN